MKTKIITPNSALKSGKTFKEIREERVLENKVPKSFAEIFGDLTDFSFAGFLDLDNLNLNSLFGVPMELVWNNDIETNPTISLDGNPNLNSMKHFPKCMEAGIQIYLPKSLAKRINEVDINSYSSVQTIFLNTGEDDFNLSEIVISFKNLREATGTFSALISYKPLDNGKASVNGEIDKDSELEKLYNLYKKLNFDSMKFRRAVDLISEV